MTMAVSTQVNPVASRLAADDAMGATAQNHVFGAAVTLHLVEIDNAANPGAAAYVKLYNAVSCVPGTTDPSVVYMAPGGAKLSYAVPGGVRFATGLSCCCVTSPGTPGTTGPTNPVPVKMLASV